VGLARFSERGLVGGDVFCLLFFDFIFVVFFFFCGGYLLGYFSFRVFLYYFLEFICCSLLSFLYHWLWGVVYLMVSSRALWFRCLSFLTFFFMTHSLDE
jgi:hypothetical protein